MKNDAMSGKPRRIVFGSDHAGFEMKRRLMEAVASKCVEIEDLGTHDSSPVDYPDIAAAVAGRVSAGTADAGVLVCGTGLGMDIAANKFPFVRATLLYDDIAARYARMHNDANVAVFGARTMNPEDAVRRMLIFLEQSFEGGRHQARLDKIRELEKKTKTSAGV
jgi:ribose 5-phosphate isomerase B